MNARFVFIFCLWIAICLPNPKAIGAPLHSALQAFHRSGQTFLTWPERSEWNGERYRIYRHTQPIDTSNLSEAQFLLEVPEESSRFYANLYRNGPNTWLPRYFERLVIQDDAPPLPAGTGLAVWTLASAESNAGPGYYAVTTLPPGSSEILLPGYTIGPLQETTTDPLPIHTALHPTPRAHVYIQYMDLHQWNASFNAPNPANEWYGLSPTDPNAPYRLQYAYDYVFVTPNPANCSPAMPRRLPLIVILHGWGNNAYEPYDDWAPPYCAYFLYPVDQGETWWFGFAQHHDYRQGGQPQAGDIILNYTEQRILRMIYDLQRPSLDPAIDPDRIYVYGHSMGGSGSLALALRYPNVFAAAYASQPVTNYRTLQSRGGYDLRADAALKWGDPALNLPIQIQAPNHWADALQAYQGTGIWDWQNHQAMIQIRNADFVPIGVAHGTNDLVIPWQTQGQPFYTLLNLSGQPWGGGITDDEHHNEAFIGLPPNLQEDPSHVPFAGLNVIRSETVPGFSQSSLNPAPQTILYRYNASLRWSASWDAWDGPPLDESDRWQISLCAVNPTLLNAPCGSGTLQTVNITPRRVQHFKIQPNKFYHWQAKRIGDDALLSSGWALANANGVLTIADVPILPTGTRLTILLQPTKQLSLPLVLR